MTDSSNRLPVLASEIRDAVGEAQRHAKATLAAAISAGEKLIEAKALVVHGEWLPWLKANVAISERSAQAYMRLARNKDEVTKSAGSADLTIDAATKVLQQSGQLPDTHGEYIMLKLCEIDPRIKITPVSLELPDDLTFEQWAAIGRALPPLPNEQ